MMYGGLGFLILGNGCFKPTVSSLVGQLYEPGDRRLDAAYTIFYMGVNVGSFAAPLICGYLGDTGDPHDFKWGFLAAGIMTLFTVVLFETQKNKYLFSPSGEPIGIIPDAKREKKEDKADHISHPKMDKRTKVRNTLVITILTIALIAFFNYAFEGDWVSIGIFTACIVFPVLILLDGSLTKIERSRIFVIYIVAFFVIFFWAAYEQAGASLTFFADEQTDRHIGSWEMPAAYFQSFNPIMIVTLAPVLAAVWSFLGKRGLEPSSPRKQAIGLFLLSMGYLFIAFGVKHVEPGVKVSMIWLTGLYLIHTMGELCLAPIGLSLVYKLSPARFSSLLMGVWYLSTSAANKFAGMLSGYYPEAGVAKSFLGYQVENLFDFFMLFVFMSGAAAVILFLLAGKLQKMIQNKLNT